MPKYGIRVSLFMALPSHIKAVAFDMDMTLLNTAIDYERMAAVVVDEFIKIGVPEDVIKEDRKMLSMNNSIQWIIANGLESELHTMGLRIEKRSASIEMERVDEARAFPDTREMLLDLHSKGYKVGLLTRGSRAYVEKALGKAGIDDLFDHVVTRSDYPQGDSKPNPIAMVHLAEGLGISCSEILYVGDEPVDWKVADEAGSEFVGVETGLMKRENWVTLAGPSVDIIGIVTDLRDRL